MRNFSRVFLIVFSIMGFMAASAQPTHPHPLKKSWVRKLGAFLRLGHSSETQELLDIVGDYSKDHVMDVERVKSLIDSGADINAQDEGDESVLGIAASTYVELVFDVVANPQPVEAVAKVIRLLLKRGADPSIADQAGFSPLMTFGNFGAEDPLVEDILAAHPNLEQKVLGYGFTPLYYFSSTSEKRFLLYLSYKPDLLVVDDFGDNLIHYTAAVVRRKDEQLRLQLVIDLLPAEKVLEWVDQPDNAGMTPLMYAVRRANMESIRLLVEKYHADLNSHVSVDDETVMSLARINGNPEMIEYLKSHGAKDADVPGATIACDRPNRGSIDFERLRLIVETCKVRSIESLLPLLPGSLRSNYTLAYATQALQGASDSHPQVMMYSPDGKLMIAFNGDPSHFRYQNLEVIQFRDSTKKFELRDIEFPESPVGYVVVSEANPPQCMECHVASSPKPNWDNWTFWPGKYKSEHERFHTAEWAKYQEYLKFRNSGRYRNLPAPSSGWIKTALGRDRFGTSANFKLDELMEGLLAEKIARELANDPDLKPFRYALMGALSCEDPISEFLPEKVRARLARSIDEIRLETQKMSRDEFMDRLARLKALLPGGPYGRYELDLLKYPKIFPRTNGGRNFEIERVSRMRYLVEGLGKSMAGWISHFDDKKTRYVVTNWTPLEIHAWQELLDPAQDAEIYNMYREAFKKIEGQARPFSFVRGNDFGKKLCPLLKARSLESLN